MESPEGFFSTVADLRSHKLFAFQDLGRALPLDQTFFFRLEQFDGKLKEAVRSYLPELAGKHFYVRLERRGFKGRIVSPELERALDRYVLEALAREGTEAQVDFSHPDAVVAVETCGDRCGVGLLERDLMDRYDFVRVA